MALNSTHRSFSCLCFALFAALAAGCGSKTGDGYTGERGQVSGTILVDGKPLPEGCQVFFFSKVGSYTASAPVDASGKYTLKYGGGNGLPAVDYAIQLGAPVQKEPAAAAPVDPVAMASKMKLTRKGAASDSSPFPSRYGSTLTSKLDYSVKPGENTADFQLTTEEEKSK